LFSRRSLLGEALANQIHSLIYLIRKKSGPQGAASTVIRAFVKSIYRAQRTAPPISSIAWLLGSA
jgi:hypothetical protein